MMRQLTQKLLHIMVVLVLLAACDSEAPRRKVTDRKDYREPLIEANKHVLKTENQHIEDYISRYQWDMTETGSGLRYWIYKKGQGDKAAKDKVATLDYTVKLITGDIVYSSDEDGSMRFQIGKGEVISGLEEGILLLNVGDKAKFIIPSHLAYGLLGDDNKIPGKASLIYDITFLELQ